MGDFVSIFDWLILACGLYLIYAGFLMVKKRELKKGLLVSKDLDLNKLDEANKDGYINAMGKKTLLFGIITVGYCAVNLISAYIVDLGAVQIVFYFLFLFALIWYAVILMKAQKKYLKL